MHRGQPGMAVFRVGGLTGWRQRDVDSATVFGVDFALDVAATALHLQRADNPRHLRGHDADPLLNIADRQRLLPRERIQGDELAL